MLTNLLKLVHVLLYVGNIACEKEQLEGIDLPLSGPTAHFRRQHVLVLLTQLLVRNLFLLVAALGRARGFLLSVGVKLLAILEKQRAACKHIFLTLLRSIVSLFLLLSLVYLIGILSLCNRCNELLSIEHASFLQYDLALLLIAVLHW